MYQGKKFIQKRRKNINADVLFELTIHDLC